MNILSYLFVAGLAYVLYRIWQAYQANPNTFMTELALKGMAVWFSVCKFIFLVSKGLLILFLSAIYAISPLDFIPDVILGLGQIDDIIAVIWGLVYFGKQVVSFPSSNR
jgi:uncharacterized membrane protein YkvA (DUF1232 family)